MSISNPSVATAAALLLLSKHITLTSNFLLTLMCGKECCMAAIVVKGILEKFVCP